MTTAEHPDATGGTSPFEHASPSQAATATAPPPVLPSAPAPAAPAPDAPPADEAAQPDARPALPTRPQAVGRAGRRVRPAKDIVRFTLDLERQQHLFLRMFALQHRIEASKVCRALLLRLESDPDLAESLLDDLLGPMEDEDGMDALDASLDDPQL